MQSFLFRVLSVTKLCSKSFWPISSLFCQCFCLLLPSFFWLLAFTVSATWVLSKTQIVETAFIIFQWLSTPMKPKLLSRMPRAICNLASSFTLSFITHNFSQTQVLQFLQCHLWLWHEWYTLPGSLLIPLPFAWLKLTRLRVEFFSWHSFPAPLRGSCNTWEKQESVPWIICAHTFLSLTKVT